MKLSGNRRFLSLFRTRICGRPGAVVSAPLWKNRTWENYEIIVVENNSETKEIFSYYDELQNNPQIRVVTYEGKFNYSKINNFGVSLATGDYVLLLNNDTQVITINWMEELLMYAQRRMSAQSAESFTMGIKRSSMRAS